MSSCKKILLIHFKLKVKNRLNFVFNNNVLELKTTEKTNFTNYQFLQESKNNTIITNNDFLKSQMLIVDENHPNCNCDRM